MSVVARARPWVEQAFHAVYEFGHVEIDEQTGWTSSQPKIRHDLGLMHREQTIDRFDFDDHEILDDQINAVA